MRLPPLPFVLIAFATPVMAAPQAVPHTNVPATPARIDVKATGTLSEVLDRIARQTGMKVTYEGGTPRTRVTANLTGVTPAQAVVSLMEGLDVNYLMGLDGASNRVETLLVVSRGGGTRSAPTRSVTSSPRMQPPDELPEQEEPEEDPMAGAVMEAMPADPSDPMGLAQPPPMVAPGTKENVDPPDAKPPQPFQPPMQPNGIGWSAPPGMQIGPPAATAAPPPTQPQPPPGPTPPNQ